MQTKNKTIRAFTLVEILTTVAIIGILLAVLIPALNQVGKSALVVKQRAQFHTIEMGLEAFRGDIGDYPPSAWDTGTYGQYSASQRLAEAIIGRDGFGFHPRSQFRADGNGYNDLGALVPLYAPVVNLTADPDNLAARKGPYLELESANAVTLSAIYTDAVRGSLVDSFILADSFRTVKHRVTGKKTGMPILYYKADRTKTSHSDTTTDDNTYNVYDSIGDLSAGGGIATKPSGIHQLRLETGKFYRRTQNPNFTSPPRPYRAESFILHSAGPDGIYGTPDDIFNFDEGN